MAMSSVDTPSLCQLGNLNLVTHRKNTSTHIQTHTHTHPAAATIVQS